LKNTKSLQEFLCTFSDQQSSDSMTHVVTSACVGHKYQDCVAVCPVEAFKEADTYLVIDPDECIDCAACVAECPVEAIFADTDVPDEEMEWIERNETESLELEIATGDSPVLAD
tara:strand:- start:351 stop:692 length:342 start_codon:yes stop_codon:yes gene_type:complete